MSLYKRGDDAVKCVQIYALSSWLRLPPLSLSLCIVCALAVVVIVIVGTKRLNDRQQRVKCIRLETAGVRAGRTKRKTLFFLCTFLF